MLLYVKRVPSRVWVICLGLILTILIPACKKETGIGQDRAFKAVPENTTVLTAFDLATLMEKANFETVKQLDFYRFLAEKAQEKNDLLVTVFSNPENAGVDLKKKAYLTIELNPDNPEEIFTALIFNLASAEDFAGFAKSFNGTKPSSKEGYYLTEINNEISLAWDDQIGLVAFGEEINEQPEVVTSFFNPNENNPLVNNEELTQLLDQSHDVTSWLTSNALAKNSSAKMALAIAKIDPEAIHDNFIHAYLDFNQGEVIGRVNYFFQEALIKEVNSLFKDKVNTDFSAYLPGTNLNACLTASLDFDGLDQTLRKRPQVKAFVDFFLKSYGLSTKNLQTILDGDIALATYLGNINNRQESIFAFRLKNRAVFEKLMLQAEENELVTKTGKDRYLISPQIIRLAKEWIPIELGEVFDNQLMIKDDIAFLAANIEQLDAIESGSILQNKLLPQSIKELFNNNPVSLFLDFKNLKRMGIPAAEALNQLNWTGNKNGSDFKLEMKTKNTNSLQELINAYNDYFIQTREQKQTVSQEKS